MTQSRTSRPRLLALAIGGGAAASIAVAVLGGSAASLELTPVPSITHEFAGNHLHGMAYVPEAKGLYLATHYGLFLLRDNKLFQLGELRDDLMGFSHPPGLPDTFYASGHPRTGGNLGVIATQDGGMSWEQIFTGMDDEVVDFHSMVASPADPQRLYGVYDAQLFVGDAGDGQWRIASGEGVALEGFCWGVPCLSAAADDRDRLFAGTPEGLYVSADAGESWERLSGETGAVAGIGAHPDQPDLLMAHTERHGVASSQDGGATWSARSDGITLGGRDFIFGFAFAPDDPDRAFAASAHGRVFETKDGGESWRMILGPEGPWR